MTNIKPVKGSQLYTVFSIFLFHLFTTTANFGNYDCNNFFIPHTQKKRRRLASVTEYIIQ